MPNYPSLAELMAAYKDNGLADGINAGVAGYDAGHDRAAADEKRKQDFQNKLAEIGIAGKKADADTLEAATKKRHQDASEVPATMTGVDSLAPLGDRPVDISALNAKTKAEAKPSFRGQHKGFVQNGAGSVVFDPQTLQTFVVDNATGERSPYNAATHGEIQPAVKPQLPGAEVEKNVGIDTLSNQVKNLRNLYSPDYVGPLDSMKQKVAQTVDMPAIGLGADPKASQFNQSVSDMKDTILRLRSGAQINEQEAKRLEMLVPTERRSDKDFLARLDLFENTLNQIREARKTGFQEAGFRTQGLSDKTQQSSANPPVVPVADREAKKAALKAKLGI